MLESKAGGGRDAMSMMRLAPSPKFTFKKVVLLLFFGVCCFLAGNVLQDVVLVNRVRAVFGFPPLYRYPDELKPGSDSPYAEIVPEYTEEWILEVADLMDELYETINRMGVWDIESQWTLEQPIVYPPHTDMPIDLKIATKYRLSPRVVDLLQLLPYPVETANNFFHDGGFILDSKYIDMRSSSQLNDARDPFMTGLDQSQISSTDAGNPEIYMRPYHVALNAVRRYDRGAVMIIDVRNQKMWLIDIASKMNIDPGILPPSQSGWELPKAANENAFDHLPARPARDVLRDCIQKILNLEWLPGGWTNGSLQYDVYRDLYKQHGWPSETFDYPGFKQALQEWRQADDRQRKLEAPFEQLKYVKFLRENYNLCGAQCKLDGLKEQHDNPDYRKSFADPKDREALYEESLNRLLRELEMEPEAKRLQEKEIELLEKQIENLPDEVKRVREERIKKYGH